MGKLLHHWALHRKNSPRQLLLTAGAGAGAGLLLSVVRADWWLLGLPLGGGLLIIAEVLRERHQGMLPGLPVAFCMMLGVVVLATAAPLKQHDQWCGPFPGGEVSLAQINGILEEGHLAPLVVMPRTLLEERVVVPAGLHRMGDLPRYLGQNDRLDVMLDQCVNGATILWGPEWSRLEVREKAPTKRGL